MFTGRIRIGGAIRGWSHVEASDRGLKAPSAVVAPHQDDPAARAACDLVPAPPETTPLEGLLARSESVEEAMPEDDVQRGVGIASTSAAWRRVGLSHLWILPLPIGGGEVSNREAILSLQERNRDGSLYGFDPSDPSCGYAALTTDVFAVFESLACRDQCTALCTRYSNGLKMFKRRDTAKD